VSVRDRILIAHPRTAAAETAARFGVSMTEARRFAAQQMAEACLEAARAGVPVAVAEPHGEAGLDHSLDLYERGAPGPGAVAWWDRSLFFSGDAPSEPCPARIDITGRGRILAYGPLIALPPGAWRICLRFELCALAARHPWRLDFAAGSALATSQVQPRGAGLYEVALEARWEEIALAEARLWVAEPAFHGALALHGARIEWAGP
jgi:hypothetical protein